MIRVGGHIGKKGIDAIFERWDVRELEEMEYVVWIDIEDNDLLLKEELVYLIPTPVISLN